MRFWTRVVLVVLVVVAFLPGRAAAQEEPESGGWIYLPLITVLLESVMSGESSIEFDCAALAENIEPFRAALRSMGVPDSLIDGIASCKNTGAASVDQQITVEFPNSKVGEMCMVVFFVPPKSPYWLTWRYVPPRPGKMPRLDHCDSSLIGCSIIATSVPVGVERITRVTISGTNPTLNFSLCF